MKIDKMIDDLSKMKFQEIPESANNTPQSVNTKKEQFKPNQPGYNQHA